MGRTSFSHRQGILSAGLFVVALLLALAPSALAKTYKPNRTSDHAPNGCNSRDCTLREAVISANASTSADKILLKAGKTYKLSLANVGGVQENAALTGDLDIVGGSLTIQSDDSKKLARINAKGIDRVFEVGQEAAPNPPTSAKFKLLKIQGGRTLNFDAGAGIEQRGNTVLRIDKSTITANHAGGAGGGFDTQHPGGVSSSTITNSTINGNTGGNTSGGAGGGLEFRDGSSNSVTNSTIEGNSAGGSGGGIRASGAGTTVSLSSVTIARNRAGANSGGSDGGGLSAATPVPTVQNSIIALNTVGTGGTGPDCSDLFVSAGVNLITNPANCTGLNLAPNLFVSDPKLGKLKDNGGPTKTIELKKGSLAINHAGAGSPKRDQRGEKRKKPDIGAFEGT